MTRARSLSQLANSSVFTVATNNRVGIGSEVPTAKLDVDGTLNVSGNATIGGVATYEDVTNVDSVGIVTARSGVSVPDGQKILLGTSNDLEIYHDGSHSYIKNEGSGNLYIDGDTDDLVLQAGDDVRIQTQGNENAINCVGNGAVEIYYNNSKKLETTSTGAKVTGSAFVDSPSASTGGVEISRYGVYIRSDDSYSKAFAIHNGGYTASDETILFNSDGSAAFSSSITAQNTILANRTGATQTAFQATLSGVTKVNITAGGSATFAGGDFQINETGNANGKVNIDSTSDGGNSAWGLYVKNNDSRAGRPALKLQNVGGANAIEILNAGGTAVTTTITSGGSANFASHLITGSANSVTSTSAHGSYIGEGIVVNAIQPNATLAAQERVWLGKLANVTKSQIFKDGSATFASQVSTSDRFDANRTGATDNVFNGRLNNTLTSSILANGSATFAGPQTLASSSSPATNGYTSHINNTEASTAACYSANNHNAHGINFLGVDGGNSNAITCKIMNDGSADFAGNIETGNYNASSSSGQGVIVYASGALNIQRAAGASVDDRFQIRSGDVQVIGMKNDGSAIFGPLNISSSTGYGAQVDMAANAATVKAQCIQTAAAGTLLFAGYQGTNKNFHVTADGGARFAAGNFNINLTGTGSNFNVRNDSSSVVDAFGVYKGGFTTNDRTVLISNDGSASFVSGGTTIDGSSGVLVTSSSGAKSQLNGDGFYQIKTDGSTNAATILASGAGSFSARLSLGTTTLNDHAIVATNNNGGNGVIVAQNMNNNGALFQGYNGASVKNVEIFGSGVAEFGGNILPKTDAGFAGHSDLGSSSKRFEDAFVRDGVTTGSDRNYKSDIRELLDAERSVAVACKSLLRAWKWTSAVSAKGDAARIHFGIIAQDLEQAFADQGLDAHNYAMFCEDTWYEVDGQQENADGDKYTADSEGAVAVTRLSVRYHELLAFIIAAI